MKTEEYKVDFPSQKIHNECENHQQTNHDTFSTPH
jgi:hypothetical protein